MNSSVNSEYRVHLEQFEGPLDLLLHLVNEARLDITEISLAGVAQEYFDYIEQMQSLNIEIESSYLVVFAQLLELKSRLLLPETPEEIEDTPWDEIFDQGGESEEEDTPLVRRLSLYAAVRRACEWMRAQEGMALSRYTRNVRGRADFIAGAVELEVSLEALCSTYRRMNKAGRSSDNPITLKRIEISVPQRIAQLERLLRKGAALIFADLFDEEPSAADIVVTFLSLLEMAKQRRVRLKQAFTAGDIEVTVL